MEVKYLLLCGDCAVLVVLISYLNHNIAPSFVHLVNKMANPNQEINYTKVSIKQVHINLPLMNSSHNNLTLQCWTKCKPRYELREKASTLRGLNATTNMALGGEGVKNFKNMWTSIVGVVYKVCHARGERV